MERFGTKVV